MWCNCVSACVLGCTSYDFVEALAFLFNFCLSFYWSVCRFTMPYNVLQLPEGGDFEALNCQPSTNFDRSTMLDLTTEPPLLVRCCYLLCFFLLYIFNYEFNDFVFTLLYKFFRPSRIVCCHFLDFSLLFQMIVTTTFVSKWFVTY
jgi:hypothetical protein